MTLKGSFLLSVVVFVAALVVLGMAMALTFFIVFLFDGDPETFDNARWAYFFLILMPWAVVILFTLSLLRLSARRRRARGKIEDRELSVSEILRDFAGLWGR